MSLVAAKFEVMEFGIMRSNTLPEQLKIALQRHLEDSDIRDEPDTAILMNKLSVLSDKVSEAKQRALALRKQKN